MHDEWRVIGSLPYEASSSGDIRRIGKVFPLRKMKNKATGYVTVSPCIHGLAKSCYVHRLVVEAFQGPIPDGMTVNHINGNRADNRLANLEVVTPSTNHKHRYRVLGTEPSKARGEKNTHAKLNAEQVLAIRARCDAGESVTALAREYGVLRQAIYHIAQRKTWSHI